MQHEWQLTNRTVTHKKINHHRMILTDTALNLYKFTKKETSAKISYSSFCALRPFYVIAPRLSDHKTCQCQYHENAKLMLEALRHGVGVVKSSKLEDSFKLVCCSQTSEACLLRSCTWCLHKHTLPTPQQDQIDVEWQQWERVQDQTADGLHFKPRLVMYSGTLGESLSNDMKTNWRQKQQYMGARFETRSKSTGTWSRSAVIAQ